MFFIILSCPTSWLNFGSAFSFVFLFVFVFVFMFGCPQPVCPSSLPNSGSASAALQTSLRASCSACSGPHAASRFPALPFVVCIFIITNLCSNKKMHIIPSKCIKSPVKLFFFCLELSIVLVKSCLKCLSSLIFVDLKFCTKHKEYILCSIQVAPTLMLMITSDCFSNVSRNSLVGNVHKIRT